MSTRVAVLLAIGIAGAGLIWLDPPTRASMWPQRIVVWIATPTDDGPDSRLPDGPEEPVDTWDAGPAWRWNLPASSGGTYGNPVVVREADGPRLAAEWGLWAGVLFVVTVAGRRLAGDPARPALAAVRGGALLTAGFAVANTQLAAAVALARGGWAADRLVAGDLHLLAFYGWGYGWPLPLAVAAWTAAAVVGRLRAAKGVPARASPRGLAWAREIRRWPREHWLGGPAEPHVAPDPRRHVA
jgi:hypothetical protein